MKLSVLSVAYPLAPVSLDTVGGAEQVLAQLDHALVAAGNTSHVIACEGSDTAGQLISIPAHDGKAIEVAHEEIRRALTGAPEADILHFHGVDFHTYLPTDGPPALATLHLPPDWYPAEIWKQTRARLHCVSETQQQRCPSGVALLPIVPNGVDPHVFRPRFRKFPFALTLGRICPEKGFHLAIDAADRVGIPLLIGGQVYPYEAHQRYFEEQIVPRIRGTRHRFLGPLGLKRKRGLLRAASCLLIPSLAPETSSLVAMEAFACGTPVVAFRSGALTEIVEDGRTGFLVSNACEMAGAIERIASIRPQECRTQSEKRFNFHRTATGYISTYRTLFVEEWQRLYDQSEQATPFASPDWIQAREEIFGDLEYVRVRQSGALTGLAILGQAGASISDYRDVLTRDAESARLLWEKLPACDLDELPPESLFLRAVPANHVEDASWCPVARLDQFKTSASLEKNGRRLGALFEVAEAEQTSEYVDALFELHGARWHGGGLLGDPRVQSFHRRVAGAFAKRSWLRFHGIRIDNRLRGVLYAFARSGRVYYYLSGFDPEFEEYSPGSLLIYHAMKYAKARGDREFDFLRGVEPYKYRWGAENRINKKVTKSR